MTNLTDEPPTEDLALTLAAAGAEMMCLLPHLANVRLMPRCTDTEASDLVAEAMVVGRVGFRRQVDLGDDFRVAFLTDAGVAIVIRRGQASGRVLNKLARRCAAHCAVSGVLILSGGSANWNPVSILGKPFRHMALRYISRV